MRTEKEIIEKIRQIELERQTSDNPFLIIKLASEELILHWVLEKT